MRGGNHWPLGRTAALGALAFAVALGACGGGDKKEEKSSAPSTTTEASISGTITLDPSLKERAGQEPLLMIMASKSPEPNTPPVVVKRVAGAAFPYEYKLTAEDITLVGSTFDGKMYVTARIDPAGLVGAGRPGTLEGAYPGNPVAVGSIKVDIVINKAN